MALDFSKYTKVASSCESCEYYDYDEYTGEYSCTLSLDEDEASSLFEGRTRGCHYYKFYDEYKSVNKQI